MPPSASLPGGGQRSAGAPKVVGEILKRTASAEGTARSRGGAAADDEQQSPHCAPAAAAMALAKDMVIGRKLSGSGGGAPLQQQPRSPRTARASGIPVVRAKPVPPSVSKRTVADDGRSRKQQQPKCTRRPTSVERVKVLHARYYMLSRRARVSRRRRMYHCYGVANEGNVIIVYARVCDILYIIIYFLKACARRDWFSKTTNHTRHDVFSPRLRYILCRYIIVASYGIVLDFFFLFTYT